MTSSMNEMIHFLERLANERRANVPLPALGDCRLVAAPQQASHRNDFLRVRVATPTAGGHGRGTLPDSFAELMVAVKDGLVIRGQDKYRDTTNSRQRNILYQFASGGAKPYRDNHARVQRLLRRGAPEAHLPVVALGRDGLRIQGGQNVTRRLVVDPFGHWLSRRILAGRWHRATRGGDK